MNDAADPDAHESNGRRSHRTVIGVGNRYRSDDAAGPMVLDAVKRLLAPARPDGLVAPVRLVESDGEPARLLDAWAGAALAIVADAVHTHAATAGTVYRLEWPPRSDLDQSSEVGMPVGAVRDSSHGLGMGEAFRLAEVLGCLPERLVVYGIEAGTFAFGDRVSPTVAHAIEEVARAVMADLFT